MTKRIDRLDDYITAGEAAQIISARLGRPIPNKYIIRLATRAKNPIRSKPAGNRFLYHRGDLESVDIREKGASNAPTNEEGTETAE